MVGNFTLEYYKYLINMIKVKKIKIAKVKVFDPTGKSLGFLNEYEFNDLRAQIYEHDVKGYWFRNDGEQIVIDNNGRYSCNPRPFESINDSLIRLFGPKPIKN